jgi:hypothetical protein
LVRRVTQLAHTVQASRRISRGGSQHGKGYSGGSCLCASNRARRPGRSQIGIVRCVKRGARARQPTPA